MASAPGMGRHVPAVGQQRHRAEDRAAGDLGHHHGRGQADDHPGAPLVAVMRLAQEDVLVRHSDRRWACMIDAFLQVGLDLALELDGQRIALAVDRLADRDPDPALADAVLLDVGLLLAVELDADAFWRRASS
jgi:hypothetical protein